MNEKPVLERKQTPFQQLNADESLITRDDQQTKPGVLDRAKDMVGHGVDKVKGVFSSTKTQELHPGNGYNWKRVTGEQGQVCWVATNDWSGTPHNILEGAKSMYYSGVEKAKGVFSSSKDTKECEQCPDALTEEQTKPGVLQGAKEKVWQGVEKAKGVFSTKTEQHPGRGYRWRRTEEQGRVRWVATNDWSGTPHKIVEGAKSMVYSGVEKAKGVFSSKDAKECPKECEQCPDAQEKLTEEQTKPGVLQSAKEKVLHGVEKAKETLTFSKSTDSTNFETHPGKGYKWKKVEDSAGDPQWKAQTGLKSLLPGTH